MRFHLEIIGDAVIAPGSLKSRIEKDEKGNQNHLVTLLLASIFAVYVMLFTYSERILRIGDDHLLKPLESGLNSILLLLIGFVMFGAWWLLDWVVLRRVIARTGGKLENLRVIQQGSFAPLVPLVGILSLVRVVYLGSYVRWGLDWVPVISVGVTLGWHYLLVYYLGSGLGTTEEFQVWWLGGTILLGFVAVNLTMVVLFILPPVFQGTAEIFIAQVF